VAHPEDLTFVASVERRLGGRHGLNPASSVDAQTADDVQYQRVRTRLLANFGATPVNFHYMVARCDPLPNVPCEEHFDYERS
jgi:hypothetical protein